MPRDAHLLPEVSQQLLRAARAGRLYKAPTPPLDEEEKNGDEDEETREIERGFTAKKWTLVPRHLEEPEPEFLAKRRKGLPSVYSSWGGIAGPLAVTGAMRKTRVKKVDADGNTNVYEVLVPEGQTVDGEVVEEDTPVDIVPVIAPGTVVEGVGVANAEGVVVASDLLQPTPPRRRPPPPRRKPKGRPKKGQRVGFHLLQQNVGHTNGAADSPTLGVPSAKAEGDSNVMSTAEDTPMLDAAEGDEEEEECEEGEEGEEGDDDEDREEGELSESEEPDKPAAVAQAPPAPTSAPDTHAALPLESLSVPAATTGRDPSSSPELPLATAVGHSRQGSLAGIPMVAINSPKQTTPSAVVVGEVGGQAEAQSEDGEIDLFSSLEKHLDKESHEKQAES